MREIVVSGNEAVLRYVLPSASGNSVIGLDSETLAVSGGVLASVRSGGPDRTEHRTFSLRFALTL